MEAAGLIGRDVGSLGAGLVARETLVEIEAELLATEGREDRLTSDGAGWPSGATPDWRRIELSEDFDAKVGIGGGWLARRMREGESPKSLRAPRGGTRAAPTPAMLWKVGPGCASGSEKTLPDMLGGREDLPSLMLPASHQRDFRGESLTVDSAPSSKTVLEIEGRRSFLRKRLKRLVLLIPDTEGALLPAPATLALLLPRLPLPLLLNMLPERMDWGFAEAFGRSVGGRQPAWLEPEGLAPGAGSA